VDRVLAEVLERVGGVATVAELVDADVTRSAVRWALSSGALVRVGRGVVAASASWRAMDASARHLCLVRSALRRAGAGAVAAAESAAVVWDLPLIGGPPPLPVVLRPRTGTRLENGGSSSVGLHRRAWLPASEITEHRGLAVTTPARTGLDVARARSLPWGVAAVDALVSRGEPVDTLTEVVRRHAGVPGAQRARLAVEWADGRSESPLESVARATVRMLGLPAPEPQVWLSRGGVRYRVDLLIPDLMTIIEVDGKVKYGDRDEPWREKRRRDDLMSWGYEVERCVAADLRRPERWGRSLLRTFRRAAARHGFPLPDLGPTFPAHRRYPAAWRADGS
jgi:hypothetical protein